MPLTWPWGVTWRACTSAPTATVRSTPTHPDPHPTRPPLWRRSFQAAPYAVRPCALARQPAHAPPAYPAAEGILLGEAYALTHLQQNLQTVALKALHSSLLLSKFDDSVVRITADGVSSVPPPPSPTFQQCIGLTQCPPATPYRYPNNYSTGPTTDASNATTQNGAGPRATSIPKKTPTNTNKTTSSVTASGRRFEPSAP